MKILLATTNLHKILEIKTILKESYSHLDIYSLRDFKSYQSPEEIYDNFKENVELKALEASKAFNMLTLADDSGLVVPELNGAPGVHSRRYAGEHATDKENILKILDEMKELSGDKRNAYYTCYLSLARGDKIIKTVSGSCEGQITASPKGAGGFGYDPVFLKHEYNNTFGEITAEVKIRISHRRRAFDKLKHTLETEFHCTTS